MSDCNYSGKESEGGFEYGVDHDEEKQEEGSPEVQRLTVLESWLHSVEATFKDPRLLVGIVAAALAAVIGIAAISSFLHNHRPVNGGLSRSDMEELYLQGEDSFNRKDYISAINDLSRISPESKYYHKASDLLQEAVAVYSDDALDKAKTYADAGDYETACSILGKALNALPDSFGTELGPALSCYGDMMRDQFRSATLESARSGIENHDYPAVIRVLRSALERQSGDIELSALLEKCEKEYTDELIQRADTLLLAEGYDSAVGVLKEAMGIMRSDSALLAAVAQLEDYRPKRITEVCECYGHQTEKVSPTTDIFGTEYTGLNIRLMAAGILYGGSSLEVYLDKKYDCFEATLAPGTSYRFADSMRITVYYDDLAVETYDFIYKTHPIDIKLDVAGVEYLKIYKSASADDELIIHNPVVYCDP